MLKGEVGEKCKMRSVIICTLRNLQWRGHIKEGGNSGHVAFMGDVGNEYKILLGKSEGERSLRTLRHRREDNIKMDLTCCLQM
jgi:hypothetical protein